MLIAQSHSDDSHVNATAPRMSRCMHFAQAHPPMSCIPLVVMNSDLCEHKGWVRGRWKVDLSSMAVSGLGCSVEPSGPF